MNIRLLLLLLVTTTLYSQNTVGTLLNQTNADNGYTLFSQEPRLDLTESVVPSE